MSAERRAVARLSSGASRRWRPGHSQCTIGSTACLCSTHLGMNVRSCRIPGGLWAAVFPENTLLCGIRIVAPAVTPVAGHGGDQQEPRPGRSGCRLGPRSTSRSGPRALLLAPDNRDPGCGQPGGARREHPGPESRSSPSGRASRPPARRPRAVPGRGRTPRGSSAGPNSRQTARPSRNELGASEGLAAAGPRRRTGAALTAGSLAAACHRGAGLGRRAVSCRWPRSQALWPTRLDPVRLTDRR
jgi:hypothetical protein